MPGDGFARPKHVALYPSTGTITAVYSCVFNRRHFCYLVDGKGLEEGGNKKEVPNSLLLGQKW